MWLYKKRTRVQRALIQTKTTNFRIFDQEFFEFFHNFWWYKFGWLGHVTTCVTVDFPLIVKGEIKINISINPITKHLWIVFFCVLWVFKLKHFHQQQKKIAIVVRRSSICIYSLLAEGGRMTPVSPGRGITKKVGACGDAPWWCN